MIHFPDDGSALAGLFRVYAVGYGKSHSKKRIHYNNRHRRSFVEGLPYALFQFVLAGELHFRDATGHHTLGAGQGFLITIPSATEYWREANEYCETLWLGMTGNAAEDMIRRLTEQDGAILTLPIESPPIQLLQELYDRTADQDFPHHPDVNATGFRILSEISHQLQSDASNYPAAIDKALLLIRRDFIDPDLSLDVLAQHCDLSKYHFARLFSQHLGEPPIYYLNRERLRHAARLLANTTLSVEEVCYESGFRSRSHFSHSFKKHFGASPKEWRQPTVVPETTE